MLALNVCFIPVNKAHVLSTGSLYTCLWIGRGGGLGGGGVGYWIGGGGGGGIGGGVIYPNDEP